MSEKKAATKKKVSTKKPFSPKLIVFGLLDAKQRAGTFAEADAPLARKAAAELGLSMLDVTDNATKELAARLRPGNAHANGSGFIGVAPEVVYASLTRGFVGDSKKIEGVPRRARNWDDLSIGDIVVSQDKDPEDGWWTARVLLIKADVLVLQWLTRSDKNSFKKHKLNVALLWPGEDLPAVAQEADEPKSVYPFTWQSIDCGHRVVAPELGPLRQYWNARVIEVLGEDRLKLEWEGYPDAPTFEQARRNVALINPIPLVKRRKTS